MPLANVFLVLTEGVNNTNTICVRVLVCLSLSDSECFQESEHLKESLKCCLLHLFGAIVAGDQVGGSSLIHVSMNSCASGENQTGQSET